jgi:hypothetical protein
MNSRPLAPFQSSACSAFTATKATLDAVVAQPGILAGSMRRICCEVGSHTAPAAS